MRMRLETRASGLVRCHTQGSTVPARHTRHCASLCTRTTSRAAALLYLADVADATGINADLADVVLYHRCVFDSRHCGLAEEFRAARRESRRLQQDQQV